MEKKGILVKTEHDEITYKVIGVAMKVHNELGPGLKEEHYQRAMEQALKEAKVNHEPQKQIGVYFHRTLAGLLFIDILVEGNVVIELKSFSHMLTKNELAQVLTYLKTSGCSIGLLINFGRKYLEYKRIFPPSNRDPFNLSDWRFVYKFKGQESRFNSTEKPSNISCYLL